MKKVLIFILCAAVAVCAFSACSKENSAHQHTTDIIETEEAVIKEADAINLVQSYSDEELGLTSEQRAKCSFMVAGNGVKIKKDNYIEVIATVKNAHKDGENTTYTFDNQGVYYIRFDGKKIMRKDMTSEDEVKYIDMKIKAVPTTTEHTHTDEETTGDKGE